MPEHEQQHSSKKISALEKSAAIESTSLSNPKSSAGKAKSTLTSSQLEPQKQKVVEERDSRVDETDLGGPTSKPAAKPSLCRERQAVNLSSPDK
jgi:hypothetical protein